VQSYSGAALEAGSTPGRDDAHLGQNDRSEGFGTVTSGTTSKDKARLCPMISDPTQTTTIEDGSSIRALAEGPVRSKNSRVAPSKNPPKRDEGLTQAAEVRASHSNGTPTPLSARGECSDSGIL
jgi:hypothetical protein